MYSAMSLQTAPTSMRFSAYNAVQNRMSGNLNDIKPAGQMQRKRPNAPNQPSTKVPNYQDPMSALAAYMPIKEKMNIQFNDLSTKQEPKFEALLTIEGVTYKGSGSSKKEAKQKMAVIALRDKYSLDASELLQMYYSNSQTASAGAKKSKTTAQAPQPMENFDCDSTIFSEDFGPNGSSDATGGYRETPFRAVNNIAQRVANMQNMQSTPGRVHQRLGAPQGMSEPEQEAKRMPLYSRYGSGPQPPMQMQQPGRDASSFCSVEELKMLLDENARLRMENEQLRAKLANIPVKSRLGVAPNQENVENAGTPEKALPVDRYAEFVKEQPSVTPRQTALEELSSLKAANKEELSFSFKRCETQLSSDNFSLCHIKIKSYPCALNFYGKGESKHDAQIASATLAVDFVKRLIDGEKLIPYHCSPITLLFMLMTTQNKIEKPSECMTCEKDESSGSQRATVKIEDYEGVEHGNSKKEAKEAVALKCLKDQYGYVPAN